MRRAHTPYRRQVLDHLGLVAGRFDELGLGDVLDRATHQHPAGGTSRVGEAVNAMVLNGLGCIHQALDLVPRFFQNTPTYRLMSPRMAPAQLTDDAFLPWPKLIRRLSLSRVDLDLQRD